MTDENFDVQGFARDINVLLVLATLRDGSKHGYQIALDVETESSGLFRFRHGTLYPILHRLEAEGFIDGSWSKEGGGRRKKVYALTAGGRAHLEGRRAHVGEVVARLLRVISGPGEAPA
ncbi:MAG: helix-turn-helix transcriptional regulator [Gemmatimonadota bacterium]